MTNAQTTPDAPTKETLLRAAYGAATTALRKAYQDEFNKFYAKEAAVRGVEWKPKPSAEQKAEQQLEALLAEHPHLAEKVADRILSDAQTGSEESAGTGVQ